MTKGLLFHAPTERAAARTAAMLPNGSREADILCGGWGDAPDDEGGERAGDGGDEDIDPEGEMAEDTQEGCAADWHAWVGADWGGDMGIILLRSNGYFCLSPVGYLGLYAGYSHAYAVSGVASSARLFRRCERVSVGTGLGMINLQKLKFNSL